MKDIDTNLTVDSCNSIISLLLACDDYLNNLLDSCFRCSEYLDCYKIIEMSQYQIKATDELAFALTACRNISSALETANNLLKRIQNHLESLK